MGKILSEPYSGKSFFKRKYPFAIWDVWHDKNSFSPDHTFRRDFWKIVYIIDGNGFKIINSRKYPLAPGNVYLIHPEDQTSYEIKSEAIHIYNLAFMPSFFENELKKLSSDFNFFSFFYWNFNERKLRSKNRELYIVKTGKKVAWLFRSLLNEYETDDMNSCNAIEYLLLLLLIELNREGGNRSEGVRAEQALDYVEMFIREHYKEDISLEELASQVSMHPNYLCRLYRSRRGISIFHQLRQIRLEQAAELLKNGDANITEICFECGFNNLSYFYRAFQGKYGLNPGDYKKN